MVSLMRAGTVSRHARTVFLRILHTCAWLPVSGRHCRFYRAWGAFAPGLRSARPEACARERAERPQGAPVSERDGRPREAPVSEQGERQEPDAAAQEQDDEDGHTPRRPAAVRKGHTRSHPANPREPWTGQREGKILFSPLP